MKTLLLAVILALSLGFVGGCATPGYSGGPPTLGYVPDPGSGEHANRVIRSLGIDNREMVDDLDEMFLLDSPSHLTKWNVR